MSEAKHTPGPWKASLGNLFRVFAGPTVICGVHKVGRQTGEYGKEAEAECEANASLIAAAPDYDTAAAFAITALAFAAENYQRSGDRLAFAQTMHAKHALIAAQSKARGREMQMHDVTPPRTATFITKATGAA